MKITKIVSILLVALAAANTAQAGEIATTVDLGTTGLGLHLSTPLTTQLNARVGLNYANYSSDGHHLGRAIRFQAQVGHRRRLARLPPVRGAFRVTGGLVFNGNSIE